MKRLLSGQTRDDGGPSWGWGGGVGGWTLEDFWVASHMPLWVVGGGRGEGHVRIGGDAGGSQRAPGLSPSSFWVARLSPLDDGSPSRFNSQPHRGLPGDHQPGPHGRALWGSQPGLGGQQLHQRCQPRPQHWLRPQSWGEWLDLEDPEVEGGRGLVCLWGQKGGER